MSHPEVSWGLRGLFAGLTLAGVLTTGAVPAGAQSGLVLELTTNQPVYHAGETLRIHVRVQNPGLLDVVDFYVVAVLPDGATAVALTPLGVAFGSLGDLAGLVPAAAGVSLAAPFTVEFDDYFEYPWTGIEPLGSYRLYLAALTTGALADGVLGPGEVVALETLAVTLAPPVTSAVDPGRAASATLGGDGGQVTATGADGTLYTLTVPAGALTEPTLLTVTPALAVEGLPLTGGVLAAAQLGPDGLRFARPVTLTLTLPGSVDATGLLGFLYAAFGGNLEILAATVDGHAVTLTLTHFTTGGLAQGDLADFLAQVTPLLAALPSSLPPSQVETLEALLLAWQDRFGVALCAADPARAACQTIYDKGLLSLALHVGLACDAADQALAEENPFAAYDQVVAVVELAGRIVQLKFLASQLGLPAPDAAVPEFACLETVLTSIVPLARDQAKDRVQLSLSSDVVPATLMDGGLILLDGIASNAALLGFPGLEGQANEAIIAVAQHVLDEAVPLCATAPLRADAVLFRPLQLFGADRLNGGGGGLVGNNLEVAAAGCRLTIQPAPATVAPAGTVQFSASFADPDGLPPDHLVWTTDCPDSGIDTVGGLFTAGSTPASCSVTVTIPPGGPLDLRRPFFKSADVTITCQAPTHPLLPRAMADLQVSRPLAASPVPPSPAAVEQCVEIFVQVVPFQTIMVRGATQQFTATVDFATNTAVTWSATGGTIDDSGLYTAGLTLGTFSVTATSVEDPTKFASADVLIDVDANVQVGLGCSSLSPDPVNVPERNPPALITWSFIGDGAHVWAIRGTGANGVKFDSGEGSFLSFTRGFNQATFGERVDYNCFLDGVSTTAGVINIISP